MPRKIAYGPRTLAALALSAGLAVACGGTTPRPAAVAEVPIETPVEPEAGVPDAQPPPALYVKLGGTEGVAAVVDAWLDDLAADKRMRRALSRAGAGPKRERLRHDLEAELCDLSDGGCTGTGLHVASTTSKLSGSEFDALVSDLELALEEKQVSDGDRSDLLERVRALRGQAVATHR